MTEPKKPQATDLTPLELAIERKMRELARSEAPAEHDARAIALLVVRHWGDDAPRVLAMATELARDEVGRWTPTGEQASTPKPTPSGPRRRKKG